MAAILEFHIAKNQNGFIHEVGSILSYGSRDIVIFVFVLFLVTAPGTNLGLSICINMKWFHSGTIVIESDQNTFMFF